MVLVVSHVGQYHFRCGFYGNATAADMAAAVEDVVTAAEMRCVLANEAGAMLVLVKVELLTETGLR